MNSDPSLLLVPSHPPRLKRLKKITVIYNVVKELSYGVSEDILADEDTVMTAKAIYSELTKEGFQTELFEVNEDSIDQLFDLKTDLIFNLCYGIGSIPKTEADVVKVLEKTGTPFTGAESHAIKITNDKVLTKKIFIENNIPTPTYQIFVSPTDRIDSSLRYPLIVKPKNEDCSLGIQNDSVVVNETLLRKKLEFLIKIYKEPVLVEEYIEGRELNLTLVGNHDQISVLPVSEILFGPTYDTGKWKIVDFDAKWKTESSNYIDTPGVCPAKLSNDILKRIQELSLIAFKACECRDYVRIDLRLSETGTPYFLEVNLNPGIAPEDGAIRSAKAAGFSYASFLKEIVKTAISRY